MGYCHQASMKVRRFRAGGSYFRDLCGPFSIVSTDTTTPWVLGRLYVGIKADSG